MKRRVILNVVHKDGTRITSFSPIDSDMNPLTLMKEELLDKSLIRNMLPDIKKVASMTSIDARIKKDSIVEKNSYFIATVVVFPVMHLHVKVRKCKSKEDIDTRFKIKIKDISKIIVSDNNKKIVRGKLFRAIHECIRKYSMYDNYYINTISFEQTERKSKMISIDLNRIKKNVQDKTEVDVTLCKLDEPIEPSFTLVINTLSGKKTSLRVSKNNTIGYIKDLFTKKDQKTKQYIYGIQFLYNGNELQNTETLAYYGIEKNYEMVYAIFNLKLDLSSKPYDSNCSKHKKKQVKFLE